MDFESGGRVAWRPVAEAVTTVSQRDHQRIGCCNFAMESGGYGRLWALISDEPRATTNIVGSLTSSDHGSTPTTASRRDRSSGGGKKRKSKATGGSISNIQRSANPIAHKTDDDETDTQTPSKRGATLRDMLSPLIMQALSRPGMFPSEVAAKLLRDPSKLPRGTNTDTLDTQVRIILNKIHGLGKVSRVEAKGPKGGQSHRYTRCDSTASYSNASLIEPAPQPIADGSFGPRDRDKPSDDTHAARSTTPHQRTSEEFHIAPNSQPDLEAQTTTGSGCLGHSSNASALAHEQNVLGQSTESASEAHPWTNEHRDIVEKILAAKSLIAQLQKINGEITMLESQQTQAQGQHSDLGSRAREQEVARADLLAEAQALREQADEAERKALSLQKDAERLRGEAQNQKGVLEESTSRIGSAREESARLVEQVRTTVEEAVGGDLVQVMSLFTRDAK